MSRTDRDTTGRPAPLNRFVWQLRPQVLEALEFLYRAPAQALGLSLVAQEQLNVVALAVEVKEAIEEARASWRETC